MLQDTKIISIEKAESSNLKLSLACLLVVTRVDVRSFVKHNKDELAVQGNQIFNPLCSDPKSQKQYETIVFAKSKQRHKCQCLTIGKGL